MKLLYIYIHITRALQVNRNDRKPIIHNITSISLILGLKNYDIMIYILLRYVYFLHPPSLILPIFYIYYTKDGKSFSTVVKLFKRFSTIDVVGILLNQSTYSNNHQSKYQM